MVDGLDALFVAPCVALTSRMEGGEGLGFRVYGLGALGALGSRGAPGDQALSVIGLNSHFSSPRLSIHSYSIYTPLESSDLTAAHPIQGQDARHNHTVLHLHATVHTSPPHTIHTSLYPSASRVRMPAATM